MGPHIAFVGPAHSGKTTASKMLMGLGYQRMAFATPVKEIAADMLNTFIRGVGGNDFYTVARLEAEKGTPAIRTLLQVVGTEMGRNWRDENTWVNVFRKRLREHAGPVVCDDCRFPNEYQALRNLDFVVVRLIRNEQDRQASLMAGMSPLLSDAERVQALRKIMEHPSERSLPVDLYPCDVQIYADTPEELLRGIEQQLILGQQRLV